MFKRCISLLLVLVTLVSFLPAPARAADVATEGTQVDFEATNDFGALLTNSLEDSGQAQTASDANRICDVQIEGDYAWVEFAATEEARVVVAIYTEDGTKMLGSGTETVSPSETEVGIQIEIDNMPQYYSAGAYLLSAADNTPLSKEFRTQLYTKPVQDIKNSTVDDYDPERVLNLDEDPTTNFAVFGENTILLDSSVVVTISGNTYTIENASDALKAMQPGDSFAQMRENEEVLIVKAAKVKVTGDTVIVTDDPGADLSDVFEVVKIEGKSSPDNTVSDDSYLDPEWEIISDEEYWAEMGEETQGREMDVDESTSFKQKYKTGGDVLSATLSADCTASVEAYISLGYQYISWKFEAKITGKISLTAKFEKEIPIIKCDFYLAAGCYMTASLNIVIEASASLSYSVSWKASIGRTYDSNYGKWEDTGSPPSTDSKTEFEGKLSFGGNIKIRIAFLSEKLTNITATAEIVREITGKQKVTELSTPSTSTIHDCITCIEGKKEIVFTFSLVFELFGQEAASLPELSHSWKEGDFYYCNDEKEYGDGKCPHMLYKVTVVAKNTEDAPCRLAELSLYQNGEPVESVTLLDENGKDYTHWELNDTDFDGNSVFFVPSGAYHLDAQLGRVRSSKDFTVRDKATKCLLLFDAPDKPSLVMSQAVTSMVLEHTKTLTANFGTEESNQDVTNACRWLSSDASILTVDNGVITPVAEGVAKVTAIYTKNGVEYADVCEVHVWEKEFIYLSENSLTLYIGDFSATPKVKFGYGTDTDKDVTNSCEWTSSDTGVVTVDKGTISTVSQGTATITATYVKDRNLFTAQCEITVETRPIVASGTCGMNLTWELDDLGTLSILGNGLMYSYSYSGIPWNKYRNSISAVLLSDGVDSVSDFAFCSCPNLIGISVPEENYFYTSVGGILFRKDKTTLVQVPGSFSGSYSIPETVCTISDGAFYGCHSLSSIVLPDNLTSIGEAAFYSCSSLEHISIPDGVTRIENHTFAGCTALSSVTLSQNVTSIGISAFRSCSSLTSIVIPESVTSISNYTFCDCIDLSSVQLPESVYRIGKNAFTNCSKLHKISLPESVTTIEDDAFNGCKSLTSIVIPDGVKTIAWGTFMNCTKLKEVTIPESVTTISLYAFSYCTSLTSIFIPEGVTTIYEYAFYCCSNLQTVYIPASVTRIRSYAFGGCSSLADVYYSGSEDQWNNVNLIIGSFSNATIHFSSGPSNQEDAEDVPVVVAETEPLEATLPEPTEAVTEPVVVETQPETTVETTEPPEETTGATEETTVEAEALSDRNWRILPSGVEMRTGAAVNLAAFTGKETTKNGLRTVAFTGLEPGEEYVLIVSLVPGSVAPEDLMYITQATADDTGALTLSYIPRQDVAAIVQLYGIPTDRGITLDREYVTMKAGAAPELLAATVTPAQWASTLVWASSDETVLAVGTDGSLTPLAPGTAYAIATVTHGKYTLSARCRVDVTEEVSNVAVTAVALGTDRVTTQLYSKDYVNFDVLLLLEQNLPQVTTFALEETPRDNGVAITDARFADEAVRSLFALQVNDDRTLTLIPTQAAIDAGKTVKSSYSSPVIVTVNGVEFSTGSALTVSVQKSTPKLTAKALSFNSFYTGQTQAISITGGTPTAITGDLPGWLKLENGKLTLTAANVKASETLRLSVETEEWAVPATVTVKVSASPKAPSLKLSKTSLTFSNAHSTGISLTLKAGKQTLEALGVKEIRAGEGFAVTDLDLDTGTFTLTPTGRVSAGKTTLTVSFYGTDATLTLPLKVSTKAPTLKFSKSSVKLNAATGDSVTLKLNANPGDLDLTQVQLSDPSGALAATAVDADGCFTLSTTADTQVKKTYTLVATAPGGKTAKLKVSTMASTPAMTAKASGKIDLTYPQVGLSITPTLKNYSGSLENIHHSLEIKQGSQWEPAEFSQYFTLGADGKLYQAPGFSLVSGTQCRITLHGQLPDGTALSAPVSVKVTQTAIPLKLSKSTLTLNKSLNEWATVAITTSVKGYTLGTPEMQLTDSKGAPSQALDLRYQEGLLQVAVNDATTYGQSYQLRLWVTPNKVSTLRVKIPSQSASAVTISAKAKGTIDVIRDNSAILVTPTYRNWAGETPLETQVAITQAPDRKHYTQDVSGSFLWQWLENGQLKVQKKPGATLEPGGKYRLELSLAGGKTATVALRIQSGSAKASVQPVTLYAEDTASQGQLRFTLTDTTLNSLERVQIKGSKHQAQFQVLPWGAGQFALAQIPGVQAKSAKVTLELFFRGNTTNKPNATVTLPVTIR